jgi:pantoate--beta-alanine ligase
MRILKTIAEVKEFIHLNDMPSGFVPTMGALHEGHLTLVRKAKSENPLCTVSIFVNPIQFNDPEDFKKYPRNFETDLEMLEKAGCDLVFLPTTEEMYPEPDDREYHFGSLEEVMEGLHRPGHFRGVAVVVRRLFEIMEPVRAYFGEKDFQQLMIVKMLVENLKMPIDIIPCDIVREPDGLAMSSRNTRLDGDARKAAPLIFRTLNAMKEMKNNLQPSELIEWATDLINATPPLEVEYIEIADSQSLLPIRKWNQSSDPRVFAAVWADNVRLIDNIELFY